MTLMTTATLHHDITAEHIRRERLAKIDLDEAIYEAAEQHPDLWPRGLITKIAADLGVSPATVRRERSILLPGVKSSRDLGW